MTEPRVNDCLEKGILTAKSGNKLLARLHLLQAAELAPQNVDCWLWLAWVADSPHSAAQSLQRVLELSPGHELAQLGLSWTQAMADFELGRSYCPSAAAEPSAEAVVAADTDEELAVEPTAEPACEDDAETPTEAVENNDSVVAEDNWATHDEPAEDEPTFAATAEMFVEASPEVTPEVTAEESPLLELSEWADGGEDPVGEEEAAVVESEADPVEVLFEFAEDTSADEAADDEYRFEPPAVEPAEETVLAAVEAELEDSEDLTAAVVEQVLLSGNADTNLELATAVEDQDDNAPVAEPEPLLAEEFAEDDWTSEPAPDAKVETGPPTVLVVDDSPTVRKLVTMTLEKRGYIVASANDGIEALKMIAEVRPGLILMDIGMPRLGGYQLCKLVKKHQLTKHIPVVMLSGKDGMFDKMRGKLVGCTDYVTKPFDPDGLASKVEKYLEAAPTSH